MTTTNADQPIAMAGIFHQESTAHATIEPLVQTTGMANDQVRLLGPQDAHKRTRLLFGRRVEHFERVAQGMALRAHLMSHGLVGALLGALLYFWLTRRGVPQVLTNPVASFLAIFGVATAMGLALGGLIAARPPRASLRAKMLSSVRAALMHDNWAVVVRPSNRRQTDLARQILNRYADEVHRAC